MAEPLVEIIVLNFNGKNIVEDCIQSLLEKTSYKNFRVVLVDNGSTDGSLQDMEKKHGNKVIFIKLPNNAGISRGFNLGFEDRLVKSDAPFFGIFNNDIVITDPDWVQKLMKPMSDPSIGITCGILKTPTGYIQTGGMMKFNGLTRSYIDKFQVDKDGILDLPQMAACLMRRETLIKTRGFDEKYSPFNSEENDWSMRAKYQGYKSYFVHDLTFLHKHSMTITKFDPPYRYFITKRNAIRFRMLHYPLHWLIFSIFPEYRVILGFFFARDGKKIRFNKTWYKLFKMYIYAILVSLLNLGEILDRRTQLQTTRKD